MFLFLANLFLANRTEDEHLANFRGRSSTDEEGNEREVSLADRPMPWLSLPFDKDRREHLAKRMGVTTIPQLVVVRASDGEIVCSDGRLIVMNSLGEEPNPEHFVSAD